MALDPPHIDPPFTWIDLPPPDQALLPMRLAAGDSADITLFRTATQRQGVRNHLVLMPIAASGKAPPGIAVELPLPKRAQFDIVALGSGRFAVAAESFGGATTALQLFTLDNGKLTDAQLIGEDADLRLPRFVRGAVPAGRDLTVINGANLAELRPDPPTAPIKTATPQPRRLAPANAGLAIATTPPNDALKQAALFLLNEGSGPQSPTGAAVCTLTLSAFPLTSVTRGGKTLFGADSVYGFDADAHDATVLVLASTAGGPQLLTIDLSSGDTKTIAWPQQHLPSGAWISHPLVLALDGGPGSKLFAIAFYVLVGEDIKQISCATLDLATLS
jgi:hypothetical protein